MKQEFILVKTPESVFEERVNDKLKQGFIITQPMLMYTVKHDGTEPTRWFVQPMIRTIIKPS